VTYLLRLTVVILQTPGMAGIGAFVFGANGSINTDGYGRCGWIARTSLTQRHRKSADGFAQHCCRTGLAQGTVIPQGVTLIKGHAPIQLLKTVGHFAEVQLITQGTGTIFFDTVIQPGDFFLGLSSSLMVTPLQARIGTGQAAVHAIIYLWALHCALGPGTG